MFNWQAASVRTSAPRGTPIERLEALLHLGRVLRRVRALPIDASRSSRLLPDIRTAADLEIRPRGSSRAWPRRCRRSPRSSVRPRQRCQRCATRSERGGDLMPVRGRRADAADQHHRGRYHRDDEPESRCVAAGDAQGTRRRGSRRRCCRCLRSHERCRLRIREVAFCYASRNLVSNERFRNNEDLAVNPRRTGAITAYLFATW